MLQVRGYEIKEEIGSGAYGAVFSAWQPAVGRQVAIKVILPKHARQPEFVQRFEAEAQMVARLEHPHIVPVYDFWRDESGAYLVMRLLKGGSLKDRLQQGTLNSAEASRLAADICGALAAAHDKGVIHRDLKPSNILFDEGGNAYLSDFGIAKNLEAEVKMTPTGAVLGTPDYISPEQIRGTPLTASADQYCLSIVFFEALTGQVPFPNASIAALFQKHLTEFLPPVTRIRPELPAAVDGVLGKAAAVEPEDRYPDILSMAQELIWALKEGQEIPRITLSPLIEAGRSRLITLPVPPTSFIGRQREVESIIQLLSGSRLVTLTGPGGTGKTRLAIQVARSISKLEEHKFPDGITFVGLASISDPELVPNAIANALGVIQQPGQPLTDSLARYYRDRQALLVLDNFEHVLEAAPMVSQLLASAPQVSILPTSREALRLSGEHEYPVPPLTVPDLVQSVSVADLTDYESVALFIHRAQAAFPGFRLTKENAVAISNICARLDGLPLAIELAAARVKLFGPRQLLKRLESRLGVLTSGARDLPVRQRTLRDTIDWSFNLLDVGEQQLFSRLAVFAGGRSIRAVETVCGPGLTGDPLDGLESLLNKSLLNQVEGPDGEPRFVMLETIHEYAWERLRVSGEEREIRDRHLRYFRDLAEEMGVGYRKRDQLTLLAYTEMEFDNLRAAFQWAMERELIEDAVRLISSIVYFLYYKDHFVEGYNWFRRVKDYIDQVKPEYQIRLLYGYGRMAWVNGEPVESIPVRRQALALSRELGDQGSEGWSLIHLAISSINQPEEYETAIKLCKEGVALLRTVDDKPGLAQGLNNLGELYRAAGDYESAREMYEECMTVCLETGEIIRQTLMYGNLSFVAYQAGDYELSLDQTILFLRSTLEIGMKQLVLSAIAMMAGPLSELGQPEKGALLLGASAALMAGMGFDHQPSDLSEIARYTSAVKAQLDNSRFEVLFAKGQAMTLEEAVAYALEE